MENNYKKEKKKYNLKTLELNKEIDEKNDRIKELESIEEIGKIEELNNELLEKKKIIEDKEKYIKEIERQKVNNNIDNQFLIKKLKKEIKEKEEQINQIQELLNIKIKENEDLKKN
jgi:hypothetical protein